MSEQQIQDLVGVPCGSVPDYRSFVRRCWKMGVIMSPPKMYSFTIELKAPESAVITSSIAATRKSADSGRERLYMVPLSDGDVEEVEVTFADLAILHRFLVVLTGEARNSPHAHQSAEFFLYTLGFRWV